MLDLSHNVFHNSGQNPDLHRLVSIGIHWLGRLAQLDRALVSGTKGRGFNSRIAHHSSRYGGIPES